MAKRSPTGTDERRSMQRRAFRLDDITKEIWHATCDEIAQDLLTQILAALGGSADTTPKIDNENIVTVGVEQSFALLASTKNFLIRSRKKGNLRLAYTLGGTSSTSYLTIPKGSSFVDEQFYTAQTIYFQSDQTGDVIEIVTYT